MEAILKTGAYTFIAAGKARSRRVVDENALPKPKYLVIGIQVYQYDAQQIKEAIVDAKPLFHSGMSVEEKRAVVVQRLRLLLKFLGVLSPIE